MAQVEVYPRPCIVSLSSQFRPAHCCQAGQHSWILFRQFTSQCGLQVWRTEMPGCSAQATLPASARRPMRAASSAARRAQDWRAASCPACPCPKCSAAAPRSAHLHSTEPNASFTCDRLRAAHRSICCGAAPHPILDICQEHLRCANDRHVSGTCCGCSNSFVIQCADRDGEEYVQQLWLSLHRM